MKMFSLSICFIISSTQSEASLMELEANSHIVYPSELAAPILAQSNNAYSKTKIPAERIGTEEDMAGTILYMCSLAGGYCNGNVVITDGGRLSIMPATY